MIKVSAPGKIHFLGEHAVVYGKPALLTTVNLRMSVILRAKPEGSIANDKLKKIIEPIIKKKFNLKIIPPYELDISSQIPIGSGFGSSAAVSASYIAALLSHLGYKWDLNVINQLTFAAEKVFHGNPSGGDNSTVVFGGLVWFRKETPDLKIIQQVPFTIPNKLSKNFMLINTGNPKETTKDMVELVSSKVKSQKSKFKKIFEDQEQLVRELVIALKEGDENELIKIIRAGEKNLESIGVVSSYVASIIRTVEKAGGAAKICGAGGKTKGAGVLLAYHPTKNTLEEISKALNLPYFSTSLGVEGLRQE